MLKDCYGKKRDNSETKNIVRQKVHMLTLIHSYTFRKNHMKHNWLCKNLSDIGKIQQIHVHLLFFLLSQILIIQIHTQKL